MNQTANNTAGNLVSTDYFGHRLLALVFVLILISTLVTLPQAYLLMTNGGNFAAVREYGWGLRLIRELVLVTILVSSGLFFLRNQTFRLVPPNAILVSALLLTWTAVVSIVTILVYEYPPQVVIAGMRIYQYVPILLLGYLSSRDGGAQPVLKFARLLRWYVAIQLIFSAAQFIFHLGPWWNRTMFGTRVFGTFPYYNQFGTAMAACACWFVVADRYQKQQRINQTNFWPWIISCFVMALLSGSRGAMLASGLCLGYPIYISFRSSQLRTIVLGSAPLVGFLGYWISSRPEFTGRNTYFDNESRLKIWSEVLSNFDNATEVIFGWGLGLATNSIKTVFGAGDMAGVYGNAHSQFIQIMSGFGIVGLVIYLLFLGRTILTGPSNHSIIVVAMIISIGIPFNIWEFFPVNVLMMYLWGCAIGYGLYIRQQLGRSRKG